MKILIEESVLQQALEALVYFWHEDEIYQDTTIAITALRSALDAAEKVEPVAVTDWTQPNGIRWLLPDSPGIPECLNLYHAPAVPEKQEPVAWMCSNEELFRKGYSRFSDRNEGDWNIPVFTHPAPAVPEE